MYRILCIVILLCMTMTVRAQQFKVVGFKQLPHDISAYIEPVRDNNDEACALLKVACSTDFAFSSPLGIVKRRNEVGEVWLYLPNGSVSITLKHPKWGVLRDYLFTKPLESRMTYELVVNEPLQSTVAPLTFTLGNEPQLLRQDTLILVSQKQRRPKIPIKWMTTIALTLTNDHPLLGLRLAVMKRHGIYLFAGSDLHQRPDTDGDTDNQSRVSTSDVRTYDTGETKSSNRLFMGGFIHSIGRHLLIYEGAGWGQRVVAWEQMDGRWFKNTDQSLEGWGAEIGAGYHRNHWVITAGVQTLQGKQWGGSVSVGLFF